MRQLIKSILFIYLMTFISQVSYSQVIIGLKTGANLSNVKFKDYLFAGVEQNPKLSFNVGLLAHIGIKDKILVRPELLYSMKGWQSRDYQTNSSGRVNLHYINIPLLVGYKPIEKLTILLGPEFGLLRSAILKTQGLIFKTTDQYNKIDIGVDLGAAYNLSPKFGVELRYNYGFTAVSKEIPLTDENGNPFTMAKDGRNRVLQVGVFYLLNGK